MNQDNEELTRLVGRELHGQVDRINDAPIGLADVKGTAHGIRRRRAIGAGLGVLAAVAIIVPVGIMGAGMLPQADQEPMPATTSPSPTAKPATGAPDGSDVPEPVLPPRLTDPVLLDPESPVGEAPQISYLTGEVLHLSDGTTVNLAQPYGSIARAGNEYVAIRDESSGVPTVEVLDAQGNVVESSAGGQAAAVSSPDGSIAAWVDADGNVMTRAGGQTSTFGSGVELGRVVAVRGSGSCEIGTDAGPEVAECSVYVDDPAKESARRLDSSGSREVVFGDPVALRAVSREGLIAGAVRGDAPCSAVWSAERELFATCEYAFEYSAGFSPDGTRIVAQPFDHDGAGPRALAILDTNDGSVLAVIDLAESISRNNTIVETAWEDDQHLLVKTEGPGTEPFPAATYNLYRVSLADGAVERLLTKDQGSTTEYQPWRFLR